MLIDYCTNVIDTRTGEVLVHDYECQVSIDEIDTSGDEVRISVSIPGMSAMGNMARAFLATVCCQAESDEWLIERVMEREGIYNTTRPGSDDAVEWVRS